LADRYTRVIRRGEPSLAAICGPERTAGCDPVAASHALEKQTFADFAERPKD
jgi:hypothetical protein